MTKVSSTYSGFQMHETTTDRLTGKRGQKKKIWPTNYRLFSCPLFPVSLMLATRIRKPLHAALCLLLLCCALAGPAWPQRPSQTEIIKGESRVLARGDLEILTYETEGDVQRLEELFEQSRKAAPVPGALTMRYLRSRTDGSVQPYALWLPKNYDPAQTYPLLIQLHGIGPKQLAGRRHLWRGMGIPEWIDVHTPVIIAHCYGRGNTFYQGMGEVDVLETIDEVRRLFPVDAERVFIMGHSMGGAGAYTVGLHHPERFGSITATDPAMGSRIMPQDDAEMPEWMRPQVAINSFARLYPNARNVPVYFKNAGAGIGGKSTEYTDGIVAQGGFSTTESFPGLPHHFAPVISYAVFIPQALAQPIKRHPPEVRLYTNTLRYNRAYWVTIDRLTRHNGHSQVTATFDDGKPRPQPGRRPGAQPPPPPPEPRPPSITVSTTNIEALTLRLAGGVVPKELELPLKVDGQQVLAGRMPEIVHLSKAAGGWRVVETTPVGRAKRHGMQGPIGDAFNSKFLAVYGEGARELAIAELDALRNPPGQLVIHGELPLKAAAKVTREDIESSNLILFGTPATNPVLKRIAGALPQQLIEPQRDGASAVFIHPNPENPERYVVVWPTKILSAPDNGLNRSFIFPVNLLPDYALVKEGKVVSAGHFDGDWKLDISAQTPTSPPVPEGVQVQRDVEYARVAGKPLLLDLYLPKQGAEKLPVIVSVHGGGWATGDKTIGPGIRFSGRGYAVASINYRLSGEAVFPAQIEDCKAAVRWLRANAQKYHLDPDRIAAWGASAGGHLVALLGTSGGVKELEGNGGNPQFSSRVQAVIDFFGPTDLLQMDQAYVGSQLVSRIKHDAPGSPESRLIGGPIQEHKDKVARANPITYVTKDAPPFLLMHGDQDPVVPIDQSRLLYDALRAAGVEAIFRPVKGAGHGFGGPEVDQTVTAFLDQYLKKPAASGRSGNH